MDYQKLIQDVNNKTLDLSRYTLIIDNDCGYWAPSDLRKVTSTTDEELQNLTDTYGTPRGYKDVVQILNAAGVNAEWV